MRALAQLIDLNPAIPTQFLVLDFLQPCDLAPSLLLHLQLLAEADCSPRLFKAVSTYRWQIPYQAAFDTALSSF